MTLILIPQDVVTPSPYPTACTGTQRYGPADWSDPNGLWDGQHYVMPSWSSFAQLDVNGTWANGYRPSVLRLDYSHDAGAPTCYFDNQSFDVYDTYGGIIGSASGGDGPGGPYSKVIALSFSGFDIDRIEISDNCYYGNISIDGLCFDPV